jgi:hypothetical protein
MQSRCLCYLVTMHDKCDQSDTHSVIAKRGIVWASQKDCLESSTMLQSSRELYSKVITKCKEV